MYPDTIKFASKELIVNAPETATLPKGWLLCKVSTCHSSKHFVYRSHTLTLMTVGVRYKVQAYHPQGEEGYKLWKMCYEKGA